MGNRLTAGSETGFLGLMYNGGTRSASTTNFNSATTLLAFKYCGPARNVTSVKIYITAAATGGSSNNDSGYGRLRVQIQTASNGAPSGTLVNANADAYYDPTATTARIVTVTFSTAIPLSAYTAYYVVVSNASGAPTTNYFSVRQSSTTVLSGLNVRYLNTTTGTFTAQTGPAVACGWSMTFDDGTEYLQSQLGGTAAPQTSYAYGTGGVRHSFYVPFALYMDGCFFCVARTAIAGNLAWSLDIVGGANLASGSLDYNVINSNATYQPVMIPMDPVLLVPGAQYRMSFTCATAGSTGTSWKFQGESDDSAIFGTARAQSSLNLTSEYNTNGAGWNASTFVYPFAITFSGVLETYGMGLSALDSTTRDGSSGASLKLRSSDDIVEYTASQLYPVTTTGNKTFSVKMRRDSTAANQPALQRVRFIRKSDGSVLATLTADANSNNVFYTYTTGSLSLTAGDVIVISYETKLASGQTSGQGYAWFDTLTVS